MSLSKWLAKFHGERIDALRTVRETLVKNKTRNQRLGFGHMADVFDADDKVVKAKSAFINRYLVEKAEKQFKRRGFLESIMHDAGLAPKTHLIETKNAKYLVQPKADRVMDDPKFAYDTGPKWLKAKLEEHGLSARDIGRSNVGVFGGKPQVIDGGEELLLRAMTPAERQSALSKFISYGKRPSLEKWIKKNQG